MLVGIDIGGTKVCVCVGDAAGHILASRRIPTQPFGGASRALPAIASLIEELLQEARTSLAQVQSIGISSPGPISSKLGKMLKPPNLPGWEGTELVRYFSDALRRPVFMNHDAKAAALAEYHFGTSKGCANLVYLTCSTGMGGGAIVAGRLVQGVCDTATEVGHVVLDLNGPECPCGQRGCFETYCGGAALSHRMQRELSGGAIRSAVLAEAGGQIEAIDMKCLIAAVHKHDPYALKIWDEFVVRLAQGVGMVLMSFNPEVLILGTIAVHSGELLLKPLRQLLPRFAWREPLQACRIEASALGDSLAELSGLAVAASGLK